MNRAVLFVTGLLAAASGAIIALIVVGFIVSVAAATLYVFGRVVLAALGA